MEVVSLKSKSLETRKRFRNDDFSKNFDPVTQPLTPMENFTSEKVGHEKAYNLEAASYA